MATFVKTPAGTWKAVIRKGGWPTTVKTFRTKGDARDWARQTEDEMVRGVFIDRADSDRMSLRMAIERYLREVSAIKKSSTAQAEQHKAKALLARLGDYSLPALSSDLVADYRDARLAEGKSATTVRLELAMLSHLYTVAIREWRMGLIYNPVANVRKPSSGQGRDRRLDPEEERRLLEGCRQYSNPMLGWMVQIALHTGMRAGEVQSLRRDQVDLQRRIVKLEDTKNGSARTVPLSRDATAVFAEALDHPVRPSDTTLVFWGEPGRDGKRRPYHFRPGWRQVLQRAGIEGLRFHDLRHEAVSRFVEAGLSDQQVSAISGHQSMQMLKRYTHLRAEDLVDVLDKAQR